MNDPEKPKTDEEFITTEQGAERLQVTPRTLQIWMKEGRVPYVKIGRSVRLYWPKVCAKLTGGM